MAKAKKKCLTFQDVIAIERYCQENKDEIDGKLTAAEVCDLLRIHLKIDTSPLSLRRLEKDLPVTFVTRQGQGGGKRSVRLEALAAVVVELINHIEREWGIPEDLKECRETARDIANRRKAVAEPGQ